MNRRQFLATATAIVGASALAACATGGTPAPTVTPASVSQDVVLIATAFAAAMPKVTGVSATTFATIDKAVADLVSVASAIGSADTIAAAQPLVVRVEADVNAVVGVLAGLPLPAPVSTVIQAASVLLPVIEIAVGILVPAGSQLHAMSPDQARAALRAVVS